MRFRNRACCALVLALAAAGAPPVVADTTTPAQARVAGLRWQPCPSDLAPDKECGSLRVPRRYDRPGGPSVRVALARIPATGTEQQRIGSLLWDAGGPGGVSTQSIDQMATRLSPQVRERFDFVAFDPRGVGASKPTLADCATPWPIRPALNPLPSWRRVHQQSGTDLRRVNRRCLRSNQQIAEVMGTNNVVRDLDRIRAAVGDRKLTFWATSYGTRIGYVYALRYPRRVRAMVMDGSIDPTAGYVGLPQVGGLSQEQALHFIRANDRPVYRSVIRTAASLTADPVRLPGGDRFSRWDWLDVVGDIVAFQSSWQQIPLLAGYVDQARESGPEAAAIRASLADIKWRPNSNEGGAFSVVNCLDYADRLSVDEQVQLTKANARRAPVLGGSLTLMFAMGCSGLAKLDPDPIPLITTASQRARVAKVPVLLANATHDGSTPAAWARQMHKAFDRPMIGYRSSQHVIWGATDSRCVNRPIDRFVLDLRMPKKSRTCDFVPSP